jgi:hypothetical protein
MTRVSETRQPCPRDAASHQGTFANDGACHRPNDQTVGLGQTTMFSERSTFVADNSCRCGGLTYPWFPGLQGNSVEERCASPVVTIAPVA